MEGKDRDAFQRALGILEGIAFTADDNTAAAICTAIEMLEASVKEKET